MSPDDQSIDQRIADTFVRLLREELTADEFAEVQRVNRDIDLGCCASHDFCDANMVMLAAFREHGLDVDVDNDDQCARWGRVWELAMPALGGRPNWRAWRGR